jgi:acetyl esterase/lipase
MTYLSRSSVVSVIRDQEFDAPGGHVLCADLYLPDGVMAARPVILWLHGGAWRVGDRRLCPDLSRYFAESGFATVSIEYRLSQQSYFPAQIEDVKTAIRWVRHVADRYGLDSQRIGLWGSSAGAHLAALAAVSRAGAFEGPSSSYAAHSSAVQATVLGYPPVDFLQMDAHRDSLADSKDSVETSALASVPSADPTSPESRLLGAPIHTRPDLAAEANPISHMHSSVPPCLIVHGRADAIVPARQSELLYESLVTSGNAATLVLIDGLGHGFLNDSALDDRGPYGMTVRSSAASPPIEPGAKRDYVFSSIGRFFRATL